MNPIGIMQGRLSPPEGGKIQCFPVATWREEFALAREAGLSCIEWIYETGTDGHNPLASDEGIAEIRQLTSQTETAVRSVCADYYMAERLVKSDGLVNQENVEHLQWLIGQGASLGINYVVLPFVDSSSLRSPSEIEGLKSALNSVIPVAERARVELHLETDLPPVSLVALLEAIDHPLVRANYDIGNSASLGHDPAEELTLIAPWLGSVHVKDRLLKGHTVPLGSGAADFETSFRLISASGFKGPFILQAAREDGLAEKDLARRNRQFVEKQLAVLSQAVS